VPEQRLNRRSCHAVIARSAMQNEEWAPRTDHFIVDGHVLKLAFHG
jgi:hypothetical protein